MNDIFFNNSGRLRSGWRFSFFLVAFLISVTVVAAALAPLLQFLPNGFENNSLLGRILQSAIGLFLAIFLGWLCGKIFEALPFRALGAWFTKYWLRDFLLGCLIGGLSVGLAVVIGMTFGGLRFEYNAAAGLAAIQVTLVFSFIVYFFGAAFEEALIRGYMFQTFVRAGYTVLAILITSLFFALGHLDNPDAGTFSSINTGLAGVWLAIAYLKTRTLWLAFGVHLGWNWFLGSIFGIEVSGLTDLSKAPLLREIDAGPEWLTGGEYGIEGGIACTFALIASTILIWYLPWLKPTEEMLELTSKENSDERVVKPAMIE